MFFAISQNIFPPEENKERTLDGNDLFFHLLDED